VSQLGGLQEKVDALVAERKATPKRVRAAAVDALDQRDREGTPPCRRGRRTDPASRCARAEALTALFPDDAHDHM
jgi:hypothetical protein